MSSYLPRLLQCGAAVKIFPEPPQHHHNILILMNAETGVQQSDPEMQEYSHTYKLIAHFSTDTIIRGIKHNRLLH